jgi:hypothetical protein
MTKVNVSPRTVMVGSKEYRVVKVTKAQRRGRECDSFVTADESFDTFKGERVAILRPV